MKISPLLFSVLESLENNPEDWIQDIYTLDNINLSIEIWTVSNFWFLKIQQSPRGRIPFTLREKWLIHKAIKKWRKEVCIKTED